MTVLSLLRATNPSWSVARILSPKNNGQVKEIVRNVATSGAKSSDGHGPSALNIIPSRFQWHKYKDQLHFYIFLGVIPLSAIVFYANVFIGPATLAEIPEGYEPKQWEYYRSPVTRFFAKHFVTSFQESYERNMHYIYGMHEKKRMRLLAWKVERLMKERGDYPNYYTTQTFYSKYVRGNQLERDYIESTTGEY